jgi:hypothetical protein
MALQVKALLVGLNYRREEQMRLYSSVYSLVAFQKCLVDEMKYTRQNFKFLVDEDEEVNFLKKALPSPDEKIKKLKSAEHVLKNLKKMINQSRNGDRLIFLFNGHANIDNKDVGQMDLGLDEERHRRYISGN